MRRRHILLLAAAIILARNPASAEVKTARIGLIQTGSRQESQSLLDAFREGLSALGWSDGSNVAILDRWAEGRTERLPGIVKELIGSGVAVLVTAGTAATLAAKRASATIPIVLVGVDDPVALGVSASRRRRQPGAFRWERHGPVSDLVGNDCGAVAATARACPEPAAPRRHCQERSWPGSKAAGHPQECRADGDRSTDA